MSGMVDRPSELGKPAPMTAVLSPMLRHFSLTDFSQVSSLFANWQGELDQLSCGAFRGSLRVVRGNLLRIVAITGNQNMLLRGRDASGMFSVHPVSAGNAGGLWHGRRLSPGQVVIQGDEAETDHRSARQTDSVSLSIAPEVLEDAARVLLQRDDSRLPRTWAVWSLPPRQFAQVGSQMARLLNGAEGAQAEQECVLAVVSALFAANAPKATLSLPGRARLVRSAEELMRSRLHDPIGAIDLCKALGVSDRTIRLAFRERYGLGPMAYYKCLRLNAVRTRLRAAPADSIADVARAFGFHHLGNFAADYRRQFGERPSETQRSPRM